MEPCGTPTDHSRQGGLICQYVNIDLYRTKQGLIHKIQTALNVKECSNFLLP